MVKIFALPNPGVFGINFYLAFQRSFRILVICMQTKSTINHLGHLAAT